jgi:hypothetical protein
MHTNATRTSQRKNAAPIPHTTRDTLKFLSLLQTEWLVVSRVGVCIATNACSKRVAAAAIAAGNSVAASSHLPTQPSPLSTTPISKLQASCSRSSKQQLPRSSPFHPLIQARHTPFYYTILMQFSLVTFIR